MAFNVDKRHILHIGEHNKEFKYQLGGRDLETVKFKKDVGVLVSNDLKPSLQCASAWTLSRTTWTGIGIQRGGDDFHPHMKSNPEGKIGEEIV